MAVEDELGREEERVEAGAASGEAREAAGAKRAVDA